MKHLLGGVGVAVVLLFSGFALASDEAPYPQVPVDERGSVQPVDIGTPVPCPSDDPLPEGSMCQYQATGGGEYAWEVVSVGQDDPPCERAIPPQGTDRQSCKVLDTESGTIGTPALVSFNRIDGAGVVKVWVLPGNGNQLEFG